MLFDDRLEVFGGCRFPAVGVDEVLHGLLELLIAFAVLVHHHTDHVQHVGPLRIDEPPCDVPARARVIGAIPHGQGTRVNGPKTLRVSLQQQLALIIPEREELLGVLFNHAEVQRGGHVGKSLFDPLIAPGIGPHRVPPPFMCDLVRGNHFPVPAIAPVHAELMPNRGVEVVANRNPYESGPRLTKVASRLLGNLDVRKGRPTEIIGVQLHRELTLGKRLLVERRRAHRS